MEWLILGIVILLTVINVPIGFGLSISVILLLFWKATASLSIVPLNLFSGASSFPLLAIPLFILAGGLMETSGISLRLVNMANSMVGFIRGGLAMVTVVATMIQSEISGSSVADAAAIGNVVIPAMEKRGYPRALSAAIVSNAASAAILIPPSIPMIIYAWMAQISVAKLFFAGFLPGFIACGAMMTSTLSRMDRASWSSRVARSWATSCRTFTPASSSTSTMKIPYFFSRAFASASSPETARSTW